MKALKFTGREMQNWIFSIPLRVPVLAPGCSSLVRLNRVVFCQLTTSLHEGGLDQGRQTRDDTCEAHTRTRPNAWAKTHVQQ